MQDLIAEAQQALAGSDYVLASELLLGALETFPEHENANSLLGSSYLALQRPDLAEGKITGRGQDRVQERS